MNSLRRRRATIIMTLCVITRQQGRVVVAFQYLTSNPIMQRDISTFQRHCTNRNKETMYTINDEICPPLDAQVLRTTVEKHCRTLPRFLQHKPIAQHTQHAFDQVSSYISNCPIILDSGCGTGRSSFCWVELYPRHVVIGIDRSMARLSRNSKFRNGNEYKSASAFDHDNDRSDDSSSIYNGNIPTVQQAAPNVFLVRAELVDFWRLILTRFTSWNITHHFMLYPNPYPKKSRYKSRWYAHPSFPLLLQLDSNEFTIRSNWKGYLEEFRNSIVYASEYYNNENGQDFASKFVELAKRDDCITKQSSDVPMAWTNFEQKYHDIGEPTYELKLTSKYK